MKTLKVFVDIVPLPLSAGNVRILRRANKFDRIVFTSKNAQKIFEVALRKLCIPLPRKKIVRVGPRKDLLKLGLRGKRVLFPRSALAPFDIVRKLRACGTIVIPITLYTARGRKLTARDKRSLLSRKVERIYFKSPSGIDGLLRQIPRILHPLIKNIPTLCIGETTAKAARKAGFKKVSTEGILRR